MTLDCRLAGVAYDGATLKRVMDGFLPQIFIDCSQPEYAPLSLYFHPDVARNIDLVHVLRNTLTCKGIRDVRVDGQSINTSGYA